MGDEWYCSKCKRHQRAAKKMKIYKVIVPCIIMLGSKDLDSASQEVQDVQDVQHGIIVLPGWQSENHILH